MLQEHHYDRQDENPGQTDSNANKQRGEKSYLFIHFFLHGAVYNLKVHGCKLKYIMQTKLQLKERRKKRLARLRDSLGSIVHQMAFTPAQAAVVCSRTPTWAYRRIYNGTFKVITRGGRILIPRAEIERYLGSAKKYVKRRGKAQKIDNARIER
jgi:hypothetical protein